MNKDHFEEWFRLVLSIIPDKSIIIIDQAPYHTMLDPNFRNPTTMWKKQQIIEWMSQRQVLLPDGIISFEQMTKPRLLELSRAYHYKKTLLLDTITSELRGDNVKLVWLPVAHCEFNAIELIWAYVKNQVAKRNTTFKIADVLRLCEETMFNIPPALWTNCVEHARKIEQIYREKEHLIDVAVEPLIINVEEDEDDSDILGSEEDEDDSDNIV